MTARDNPSRATCLIVLSNFYKAWFGKSQFVCAYNKQLQRRITSVNYSAACKDANFLPVKWLEPNANWIKINIDGSRNPDSESISSGGVLRNNLKEWVRGFVMNRGSGSVIEAELWSLYEGLKMAWNSGFKKVTVESDSLTTVQLMCRDTNQNHPLFNIIQSCKTLLLDDWDCNIKHIYREGNKLADGLARMGLSMTTGIVFFDNPPPEIIPIFEADCRGLTCFRQTSALSFP